VTRRLFIYVILLVVVAPVPAVDEGPQPLAGQGALLAEINHALIALSTGDTAPLESLPAEVFTRPMALADEHDPDLARRWTASLPATVARWEGAPRDRVLASLDGRFRSLGVEMDDAKRAALAVNLLPAPAAEACLAALANRAFDRGRFTDFLAMPDRLPVAAPDPRRAVALRLSGRGPEVDESLRLSPPGLPRPIDATPPSETPGITVFWRVLPGWLLACDPWGQVAWQYRVDKLATVLPGNGAALVWDGSGLRVVDETGAVTRLKPLPARTRMLAVAGGAAWFASGTRGWRLVLKTQEVRALDLGDEALAPPLVRGSQSLWLTPRQLALFDDDRLVQRLDHGLPAAADWKMAADRAGPCVVAPDGRAWRLESLAEQLAHGKPLDQARLLMKARRFQEVVDLLDKTAATPEEQEVLLRAYAGLGPERIDKLGDRAMKLATTPRALALVLIARVLALKPVQSADTVLYQHCTATNGLAPRLKELCSFASANAELEFTLDAGALGDNPESWVHRVTGRGLAELPQLRLYRTAPAVGIDAARPVQVGVLTRLTLNDPEYENIQRLPDDSRLYRDMSFYLERTLDSTSVSARNSFDELLWRRRWRAPAIGDAPSQTMDIHGGLVFVCEGATHVTVLDAGLGSLAGVFNVTDVNAIPEQLVFLPPASLAGLTGLRKRLLLASPATPDGPGGQRFIDLPARARWMLALDTEALVMLDDGKAMLYPDGREADLPAELRASDTAPIVTGKGLTLPHIIFPWLEQPPKK
jgi:hypothetical protein